MLELLAMRQPLTDEFYASRPIVGMVHLGPLPGSARCVAPLRDVIARAVADARALCDGGVEALMVENFFDAPFHKSSVGPHTVAAMTAAAAAIRDAVDLPLGVNVLRNDVRAALAIAHVVGAQFVRCNVYVGAAVTDQGIIEGAARQAVSYRRELGAEVAIWADVAVKHASQLGDATPADQARDAVERGMADAVIVSGAATGAATPLERVRQVKLAIPGTPVFVGSGLTLADASELLAVADGAIVGSSLKAGGVVSAPVDIERVRALVAAARD